MFVKTVTKEEDVYIIGDLPMMYFNLFGNEELTSTTKVAFDILNGNCFDVGGEKTKIEILGLNPTTSLTVEGLGFILTRSELIEVIKHAGLIPLNTLTTVDVFESENYSFAKLKNFKGTLKYFSFEEVLTSDTRSDISLISPPEALGYKKELVIEQFLLVKDRECNCNVMIPVNKSGIQIHKDLVGIRVIKSVVWTPIDIA